MFKYMFSGPLSLFSFPFLFIWIFFYLLFVIFCYFLVVKTDKKSISSTMQLKWGPICIFSLCDFTLFTWSSCMGPTEIVSLVVVRHCAFLERTRIEITILLHLPIKITELFWWFFRWKEGGSRDLGFGVSFFFCYLQEKKKGFIVV